MHKVIWMKSNACQIRNANNLKLHMKACREKKRIYEVILPSLMCISEILNITI